MFKETSSFIFYIIDNFFLISYHSYIRLLKNLILTDRYIIFIVIPLIVIISNGLISLKNRNIKITLISIIVLSTLADTSLRIFKNESNKPEIKKSLEYIYNSNLNEVLIDNNKDFKVLKNYIINLNP